MTDHVPESVPSYERFTASYPSGTVVECFYADGEALYAVQVAHPLAVVEADEGSWVRAEDADRP